MATVHTHTKKEPTPFPEASARGKRRYPGNDNFN